MNNISKFQVEELTDIELSNTSGGGIIGDCVEFIGEAVGTVIGGAICMAKCFTNWLGVTSPK